MTIRSSGNLASHGSDYLIGLDVGRVRTGVAVANRIARIARPLKTLSSRDFEAGFNELIREFKPSLVVVGRPRSLSGEETDQTRFVYQFIKEHLAKLKVELIDEALTSRQAEAELVARAKPYKREDIDALAATYILQDFIDNVKLD